MIDIFSFLKMLLIDKSVKGLPKFFKFLGVQSSRPFRRKQDVLELINILQGYDSVSLAHH